MVASHYTVPRGLEEVWHALFIRCLKIFGLNGPFKRVYFMRQSSKDILGSVM